VVVICFLFLFFSDAIVTYSPTIIMSSNTTEEKPRAILSIDIEADGASASLNSMLSFGMVVFDSTGVEIDSWQANLYARKDRTYEARCIEEFWMKNPAIWAFVHTNRITPTAWAAQLAEKITALKHKYRIMWVANPAAYDWQWVKGNYEEFKPLGAPDIGYSAKCMGTLMSLYARQVALDEDEEELRIMKTLFTADHVAHNPEHDARVQGKLFFELCKKLGDVHF
jgi:hypothetical protein